MTRATAIRRWIVACAAGIAIAGGAGVMVATEPPARSVESGTAMAGPLVRAVGPIGITVSDLEGAVRFYTGVLGFERVVDVEIAGDAAERLRGLFGVRALVARLRLGSDEIELTQYLAPEGRPIPADSRSNDRWFQHIAIVVADMDRAYALLRQHRVRHASSGPQTLPAWNTDAAGISAFYFKDPDGHVLEVIHFPAGKGDPKWHAAADSARLFLGIDHTAIVVADTERSLEFYRDTLGLHVAGSSENYGTEQEHLNNVFGARLRITSLRAESGPGVELLEYLSPSDGRAAPTDEKASDLTHWTTGLIVWDGPVAEASLRAARARWVSPGLVETPDGVAMQVRDPDGHALIVSASASAGTRVSR
ncbi:MAG: VOC family protein [Phycisphaeraceae bacterium]|nr:VOC family protein [Phycisphaeraceae bacterium]